MVEEAILLSGLLFAIGAVGALIRRHALVVLMCLWLMTNAVLLALVAFSRLHADDTGQVLGVLVMAVSAAELVVGLGVVFAVFRNRNSLNVEDLSALRW